MVLINDVVGSTITVTGNEASDSTCAGVVSSGSIGPRSLTVTGNLLVGLGGNAIDLVGTAFIVEDNNLSDCQGFAIALRGFTQLPYVGANIIERAENGLYLEAKERTDGLRLRILLDNITWEVNGTAVSTKNLDLVITNSTLAGRRALIASYGTITAISTKVPYLSGSTSTEGIIEVYYRVGINLTWANATGVDSGLPAGDALVVFKKSTGQYLNSRIADRKGNLPPDLLPSWRIEKGHVDRISPYKLEITASGLLTHTTLKVEEDHQATVPVIDWALPFVSVEKPYDGALVNTADLTVKGSRASRAWSTGRPASRPRPGSGAATSTSPGWTSGWTSGAPTWRSSIPWTAPAPPSARSSSRPSPRGRRSCSSTASPWPTSRGSSTSRTP